LFAKLQHNHKGERPHAQAFSMRSRETETKKTATSSAAPDIGPPVFSGREGRQPRCAGDRRPGRHVAILP
jgi:hypothetical protein